MADQNTAVDVAVLRELQDIMEDEFSDLLATFLRDSDEKLIALGRNLNDGDPGAFGKTAHSLKGSAINIGARQLSAICLKAETAGKAGDLNAGPALVAEIAAELQQVQAALRAYVD